MPVTGYVTTVECTRYVHTTYIGNCYGTGLEFNEYSHLLSVSFHLSLPTYFIRSVSMVKGRGTW
jgi:hypothetical protein